MADILLSEQQRSFFDTFGYLAFPGLMKDRIDEIIREFEAIFAARGGGHHGQPHSGKQRSCIVPFLDQSAVLCSLLDDPRIHGIAVSLLGEDFNYMPSDGNYYAGDTQWHSDGFQREGLHAKIAFYLDPLTRDTGCLRVIPGSHKGGDRFAEEVNDAIYTCEEKWNMRGRDLPAVALENTPGDVVIFNHNIKHAAFGGGGWRRMFTINLCRRYPESRLPELREYISNVSRFWVDRAYGDIMMNTAGPGRRRHLEQVMANDGHVAELSRKARAQMAEPARG